MLRRAGSIPVNLTFCSVQSEIEQRERFQSLKISSFFTQFASCCDRRCSPLILHRVLITLHLVALSAAKIDHSQEQRESARIL